MTLVPEMSKVALNFSSGDMQLPLSSVPWWMLGSQSAVIALSDWKHGLLPSGYLPSLSPLIMAGDRDIYHTSIFGFCFHFLTSLCFHFYTIFLLDNLWHCKKYR